MTTTETVRAVLKYGPCSEEHVDELPSPPPEVYEATRAIDVPPEQWSVGDGQPYREQEFESHPYRLIGVDNTPSGKLAVYLHAPELA